MRTPSVPSPSVRLLLRSMQSTGVRSAVCVFGLGIATPALAGDPIVLIGGPPVVGDGQTTATIQIWSPAVGAEAKISVKGATLVGEPAVDGGDFASFRITPPATTEAGELQLKVKVSSDDGKGAATLRLPVVPPDRGEVGIAFDPPQFRLGIDNAVSVRITLPEGPRKAGTQSLEVHSSIGVIDTVTAEDGGRSFLARWRPPKSMDGSQMALFAIVDKAAPDRVMGTAAYPVLVKKPVELPAPAGSTAVLTVGERQFGPLPASASGRVTFDMERDPRVSVGRLRIIAGDGTVSESNVELAFGEGPRFTVVPPPVGARAAPDEPVKVTVFAVNADGTPWTGKAPEVTVDRGSVSAVVAASQAGRFVVTYQPADSAGTVTFTAKLDGRSVRRTMELVPPVAFASRTGSFDPEVLEGTQRSATFQVGGDAPETIRVSGGATRGRATGSGPVLQPTLLDSSNAQMVALGTSKVAPSGRPVTRLHMWTADSTLQADAVSVVPFVVVALDDQGQPVSGLDLSLSVRSGTGTLPPSATTGPDGLATGLYTAGNQVGPVTLAVEGGGVSTASPIFLEGAGFSGAALAASGDARALSERDSWISTVAVARAGRPLAPPQPAVAPMTGADVARLEAEKKAAERAQKMAARAPAPAARPTAGSASAPSQPATGAQPTRSRRATARPGDDRYTTQFSGFIGAAPRNYTATPTDADSDLGVVWLVDTPGLNAPSLHLDGLHWSDRFGAEARLRYIRQPVTLPFVDDPVPMGSTELLLGGRIRTATRPGGQNWSFGAGLHSQNVSVFGVGEEDGWQEFRERRTGVRGVVGYALTRRKIYYGLDMSGSFASDLYGGSIDYIGGYELTEDISLRGMFSWTFRGGSVSSDDTDFLVLDRILGFYVGATYTLP